MARRDGMPRRASGGADAGERGLLATLFEGRQAGWGAIAVVAAAVICGLVLWTRVSDDVRSDKGYVLEPAGIELLGIAPWVRSDLKGEALRNASLDGRLPLDDPELSRRLARAFDMHPWVRQVKRVDLHHPARAVVEVVCREPVAMVGVKGGLLAIDAEAVVLPSTDFTAEAAARYPRIAGVMSSPQGPEGSPWGDPVVEEAAALAMAIGPEWNDLGLIECRPEVNGGRRIWVVSGDGGRTIRFGAAPGREVTGEPVAAAKVARLGTIRPTDTEIDLTVADDSEAAGPEAIRQ
ncbi:MAG: cell division protein FtsQ/DivIB [Planctomycetia bacterium]